MKTYIIKSQKELEKYKDEYGYYVPGNAEFEYSAEFQGRLRVDGYIEVKAGEYIKAGWYIKAGGYIEAGWYIEAGGSIKAGGYIEAGEYIKAGGCIEAGWYIEADEYIKAGEYYGISAGLSIFCKKELSFGLNAYAGIKTWGEATEEEKTITCGKLTNGNVKYGILNETGLDDEKPAGKKVRIKLADNQIVEGTIVEE